MKMTKQQLETLIENKIQKVLKEKKQLKEETGLNKKFDHMISKYKDLEIEKQKMIKDFVTNFKKETDSNKKENLKKKHIEAIKKIDSKIKDAMIDYNKAIVNLVPAEEEELL